MAVIRSEAPGKIVLSGEYAVLHGAHGIAAAVNRYARVAIERIDEPVIYLRTPGYRAGTCRYELDARGQLVRPACLPDPNAFDLFEKSWASCRPAEFHGATVTIDTTEFVDERSGAKLGLGSSAASCVALVAALQYDAGMQQVFSKARAIHRDLQGGGSGIDVACAVHGGVIAFREGVAEEGIGMPRGLHAAVLWSGQPASTRERLERLSASLSGNTERETLTRLCRDADALSASWRRSDAQEIIAGYRNYVVALQAFDRDHELGVFAAGHAELTSMALDRGILYKPCGAGGGDVGIAMSVDARQLDEFTESARRSGFMVLDASLGAAGLRIERDRHDG